MSSRKDVLQDPGVRGAGRAGGADGVQQHQAVFGQEASDRPEEDVVESKPDMFEHPDGDDPVEGSLRRAIVLVPESDPVLQAGVPDAGAGDLDLFFRQARSRDARRARRAGEVDGEPAPSASDIQHSAGGLKSKLCGDMPFLGELSILQRLRRILEVRTRILIVGIKEQPVEGFVEVVVMSHVLP